VASGFEPSFFGGPWCETSCLKVCVSWGLVCAVSYVCGTRLKTSKDFTQRKQRGREGNRRKIEAFTEETQRAQRQAAAGVRESDGYI
jgi:hypothetical protein